MSSLPARGEAVRSLGMPVPPARMPLVRDRRLLKRWKYVGFYSSELMLCAAEAHVGPLGQRFWGVALPDGRLLAGRALVGSGGVSLSAGRLRLRARADGRAERAGGQHGGGSGAGGGGEPVEVDLTLDEAGGPPAVESVSGAGARGYVWTRKLAGMRARGHVLVDGRRRVLDGEAVIDDTAGYHPRHTLWRWSAGVGRGAGGERIGWNLVEGVNDDPQGSERTLWVDGRPVEVGPVHFSDDLGRIAFVDGGELRFEPWATLAHRTRLGLVRSDYRQPFGQFSGELPGGLRLTEGHGVAERHEAWW